VYEAEVHAGYDDLFSLMNDMIKTRTKTTIMSVGACALGLLGLPALALAGQFDPSGGELGIFLRNVIGFINTVIIPFILGIGFLFFVWGMFMYFIKGGADDDAKEKGKQLIIYATAGFVLIFIFWGLIELLTRSTGFQDQSLNTNIIPRAPGF
jgi:hypothetical protein